MRNISLEKLYTKCDGETIPRPFSKKVLYSLFLSYAKLRVIEIYQN